MPNHPCKTMAESKGGDVDRFLGMLVTRKYTDQEAKAEVCWEAESLK
jgi:hypothetical protein